MNRVTAFVFGLVLLWVNCGMAQQAGNAAVNSQYQELQQVLEKLRAEVEKMPHDIGRVANQEMAYDSSRITQQGFRLIEHEIERTFTEHGRINMLSLEEFDRENVLRVTGTDSTLLLKNTNQAPDENENSSRLLELSEKYGVDAFMKGYVQYRNDVGYTISVELISPSTREVIWSKTLVSKDLEPEEEVYKGKLTLLTVGASNIPASSYLIGEESDIYGGDFMLLDYNVRLAFRQPVNSKNSGYIGVQGGYHYYNIIPVGDEQESYEPYDTSIYDLGLVFYKTLAEKEEQENAHWIDLFIGPNLLMPSDSNNLFALTQGVNVNVAENVGVTLDVQYLFSSDPSLNNAEDAQIPKTVELNTIGYGFKILLRL